MKFDLFLYILTKNKISDQKRKKSKIDVVMGNELFKFKFRQEDLNLMISLLIIEVMINVCWSDKKTQWNKDKSFEFLIILSSLENT